MKSVHLDREKILQQRIRARRNDLVKHAIRQIVGDELFELAADEIATKHNIRLISNGPNGFETLFVDGKPVIRLLPTVVEDSGQGERPSIKVTIPVQFFILHEDEERAEQLEAMVAGFKTIYPVGT